MNVETKSGTRDKPMNVFLTLLKTRVLSHAWSELYRVTTGCAG